MALVAVAVILGAARAFAESSLGPQGTISDSFKVMEQRTGDAARTEMGSVSVAVDGAGTQVDWRVRNAGQTKLRDFPKWDLVIRYHGPTTADLKAQRLTYTTAGVPAAGQWTVSSIYLGAGAPAEVYEPGIVNPAEEFNIRAVVNTAIAVASSDSVTASAPNGVAISVGFTR